VSFGNPDFVDVVVHAYRHVFGVEAVDPLMQPLEDRLAQKPAIIAGGDNRRYDRPPRTRRDGGPCGSLRGEAEHRVGAAGHNVPQEKPDQFAVAVLKVQGWL
jgi:hypothetical protein